MRVLEWWLHARRTSSGIIVFVVLAGIGIAGAAPDARKPVRTVSEVEARGREVITSYSDPQLAAWGFLDVTKPPYSADPTGARDCTSILQRAIEDARDARLITYLPAGRYLVSDTIEGIIGTVVPDQPLYTGRMDPWVGHRSFDYPCVIAGAAHGGRTTLVLGDHAPGFDNPQNPKPLLYFWARHDLDPPRNREPTMPSINFNQKILCLDFELGNGNAGAIAIDHRGAEGATIEDVTIRATGAFAGIRNAPGSGGAMHGLRVTGGRFGLYLTGSQPSPLVSDVVLRQQREASIFCTVRGPLTLVGADIDGAPIRGERGGTHWDAAINIIDSIVRLDRDTPAIATPRSVVLENVWFDRVATIAAISGHTPLLGNRDRWTQVVQYAAGGTVKYPQALGGQSRRDPVWIAGKVQEQDLVRLGDGRSAPPADLLDRHRFPRQPDWFNPAVANVRMPPWNAKADGEHDDTATLQAAIDASEIVFLPKGVYRLTQPLRLQANTVLFGVTNLLSVLTCAPGKTGAFSNVDQPLPLIDTPDDARARTRIAMLKLELPVLNPCVYALRWRVGRDSVLRNIYPIRTAWHPEAPAIGEPMLRIEGNGGGRWYSQTLLGWWSQGPDYRHLLVAGTREPLRFYHLQPQHGRSEAMVEVRDAQNVTIYSTKMEGNYTSFWFRDSRHIRLFGFSGITAPRAGWPVFRLDDVYDIQLAGLYPQLAGLGRVGALGIGHDPRTWLLIRHGATAIRGDQQLAFYGWAGASD